MAPLVDIDDIMSRLATDRPIFHSEADFQHALAWKIHELMPEAQVRLEVSSGRADRRESMDILVRVGDQTLAIELKYKKRKLDVELGGEKFAVGDDVAQDHGRYDFIKDITRLEQFVSAEPNREGYAILLTNDVLYWRESKRITNSAAFFLHEGRTLECDAILAWHADAGEGTTRGALTSFACARLKRFDGRTTRKRRLSRTGCSATYA